MCWPLLQLSERHLARLGTPSLMYSGHLEQPCWPRQKKDNEDGEEKEEEEEMEKEDEERRRNEGGEGFVQRICA